MYSQDPIILYDAACPMCRTLAAFVTKRSGLSTASWQDFRVSEPGRSRLPEALRDAPPDRLRVLTGESLLEGEDAWSYLISNWQDLSHLDWLASRTGLRQPVVRSVARAGHLLKRLCLRCPS